MSVVISAASAVASPIVREVIRHASSLTSEQYKLVKKVKKTVRKLESILTSIQSVLEDAEGKAEKSKQLKDWLAKLRDAAYDAEDVLHYFKTEADLVKKVQQGNYFRSPYISYKFDAARKIKELLERFDDISKEKEQFHLKEQPGDGGLPPPKTDRETGFLVDESRVVGRDADREKIIGMLLSGDSDNDCNFSAIAITGMGGLGKTTLAQLVYDDGRIKQQFDPQPRYNDERIETRSDPQPSYKDKRTEKRSVPKLRLWVFIGEDFDLKKVLKELIKYHSKMPIHTDWSDFSLAHLQSHVLDILEGKRFLLVLDGVWDVNYADWESLQVLLKRGGNGSKVLVTSRHTNVLESLDKQRVKVQYHPLSDLRDEECLSLFKRFAFKEDCSSNGAQNDLVDIGKEIIRKCNNLPLAVKAMGGLLRGTSDIKKWREILESEIWQLEEAAQGSKRPEILPALKLSYDHLPSHLKQCFAFCSLFPKAYSFSKKELIKLWMAEAYIQREEHERAEVTGSQYFDDLLVRSFFQSSNIERMDRYRMHDLIHDLALSISRPECCQVRDKQDTSENTRHKQDTSDKIRHASLLCEDVVPPTLKIIKESKKLRTLLFPTDYLKNFGQAYENASRASKLLDKMFRTLRYIRVLDLSSSAIEELPESVEDLKLLRYLDLSKTEIKMLPNSICNLYNLETLKLLDCLCLFKLPKDLGNLINLRHLEVDEVFWNKASKMPKRIGKLINLEKLQAFWVGRASGYGIDELKDMAYLTGTLHISKLENAVNAGDANLKQKESLEKVVFEWSDREIGDDAGEMKVLEDLEPHSNIKELQIIHYKGSTLPRWMCQCQWLWWEPRRFHNLVSISLNHCTKCRSFALDHLPRLHELSMKGMQYLEDFIGGKYPSLSVLKISDCPRLQKLPRRFLNLRIMKIKKCHSLRALPVLSISLEILILNENFVLNYWNDYQGRLPRSSYSGLLELKMISCPKMRALPMYFTPEKLDISGCELLRVLPDREGAQRLHHMALDTCPDGTLVSAIPSTGSLETLVISNISNMKSFPKWPDLSGLKALYIRDCKVLETLSKEDEEGSLRSLTSLKTLSIRGCPNLVTLGSKRLPNALECFIIGSCPKLDSLGPEEILKDLTSLKDLYIEDCPLLQSLPGKGLPSSLQHLYIQGCPLLTQRCQEAEGGPDWPKIMHIPDLEIDFTKLRSAPHPKPSWYNRFIGGQDVYISASGS